MRRINDIFSTLIFVILLGITGCAPSPTQVDHPDPTPSPSIAPSLLPTLLPTSTPFAPETPTETVPVPLEFNRQRAYEDVIYQVNLGPRLPGSQAHSQAVEWLVDELKASKWDVVLQETTFENQPVQNIIARRGSGNRPFIIIGAHYDSRFFADHDPDPERHNEPVPGANDGASGVAVLLELARVLPQNLNKQIWLVFFDSEDQGQISGWDWILGSRAFVDTLQTYPDAAVVIDMIGDADLSLPKELSSNSDLQNEIWQVAANRGYESIFLNEPGYGILDDHTPFLQKGIPAIDIIDFNYPYWHTTGDTPDKVSPDSLFVVGDTLLHWLLSEN